MEDLLFSGDDSDPLAVRGMLPSCQIAPQTFDRKAAQRQFLSDRFGGVILKPISIDRYFSIPFDDRILIEPDGLFRVVKPFFQYQVRTWFPESAFRCVPVVLVAMLSAVFTGGDIEHKLAT